MKLFRVGLVLIIFFVTLVVSYEIIYPLLPLWLKLAPSPEPFPGVYYIPGESNSACGHVRYEGQSIEYLVDENIQVVEKYFANQFPAYCEADSDFETVEILLWSRCEEDSLCRIAQCDLKGYRQFFTVLLKPINNMKTQVWHFHDLAYPTFFAPEICGGA